LLLSDKSQSFSSDVANAYKSSHAFWKSRDVSAVDKAYFFACPYILFNR
jgi:hypothetical protein